MPSYDSLSTQITAVKNEIDSSLAASNYSAQDLVFIAKALETLGAMLGVNDIVAATAANVTTINSTGTTNVNLVNTARTAAVSDIESRIAFNPMLLIGGLEIHKQLFQQFQFQIQQQHKQHIELQLGLQQSH